jgi:predicted dehydrogenase
MKMLKAIIIGASQISNTHAYAINELSNIELSACWNRIEEEKLGKRFEETHHVKYYSDLNVMLEEEQADIVINALPPRYHALGLEEAAKLGACLVVEKPMGVSIKACREILDIAKTYGVSLAVSESSAFDKILRACQANRTKIGHVLHQINTNYRYYFAPERCHWISDPVNGEGGMILNVGVHRVATMRILAGSNEKAVTAQVGTMLPQIPVPGDCSIQIEYENGTNGTLLMCGYHRCGKAFNLSQAITDKGIVRIADNQAIFSDSAGNEEIIKQSDALSKMQYVNFYKELGDALLTGRQVPYNGEEGMKDVAVIRAAILSSKEKRKVTLAEVLLK